MSVTDGAVNAAPVRYNYSVSQSSTCVAGTPIRFDTSAKPFTSFSGTIVTPDTVTFKYQVQGQTEVSYTWTNPSGDPSNVVTNYGVGLFYAVIQTTGLAGTWTYQWSCAPSSGTDVTKTQTFWDGEVVVSPAAL